MVAHVELAVNNTNCYSRRWIQQRNAWGSPCFGGMVLRNEDPKDCKELEKLCHNLKMKIHHHSYN